MWMLIPKTLFYFFLVSFLQFSPSFILWCGSWYPKLYFSSFLGTFLLVSPTTLIWCVYVDIPKCLFSKFYGQLSALKWIFCHYTTSCNRSDCDYYLVQSFSSLRSTHIFLQFGWIRKLFFISDSFLASFNIIKDFIPLLSGCFAVSILKYWHNIFLPFYFLLGSCLMVESNFSSFLIIYIPDIFLHLCKCFEGHY